VEKLRAKYLDFSFVLPTVSTVSESVKKMVAESNLPILVVEGEKERHAAFQNADVAIAASGTVALELAILDVPHIIAYKVPKFTEWVAKRVLHIQFVNLTNILLGYEVVPELLQTACNPENILQYVEQFLSKDTLYRRQIENFAKLRKLLGMGEQTPSDNAANEIIKRLKRRK
jgi:lipid-A-disaccharide synthase